MRPCLLSVLLLTCVLFICCSQGMAETPPRWIDLDDPLLWSHVVVRGTIADLSYSTSILSQWGVGPAEVTSTIDRPVVVLKTQVRDVMKGVLDQSLVDVWAFQSRKDPYEVGQEVILCLYYNSNLGQFTLRNFRGLYVLQGEKWIRQRDSQEREFGEIRNKIESMAIDSIAERADIVAVGRVLSVGRSYLEETIKGKGDGNYETVTLQVSRVLKGQVSEPQLTYGMLIKGSYWPSWRTRVPGSLSVGDELYVFLKQGKHGLYPFAGINGLLKVKGLNLMVDSSVPFPLSKSKVEEVVRRRVADGN